ncbi:DUF4275 family protein [Sporosarcina sp. NPDC096371]|uniref:DUF4275 family protein n=1 Tax=Sporosarcina sp. NPDC096371 TaxID=3364530 RepID=UPI00382F31AD
MDIVNRLKNKNVRIKEIPSWGSYLRHQWEERFAGHLSNEEKEEIGLHYNGFACGYLWHVFSYEKRGYVKEKQANEMFNNMPKHTCFVFYQHSDYAFIIENTSFVTAEDFVEKDDFDEGDIYVVDKDFTWTYVHTHEESCGPYFSRNNVK